MALSLTHQIGALSGTPITAETGAVSGDSTSTVSASWKSPTANLRCKIQNSDLSDAVSPPLSPCRSPALNNMRPDLSVACRAFATDAASPVTESEKDQLTEMYRQGGGARDKGRGVPVFVMMPLDSVTMSNTVNRRKAMDASLRALKSAGVEGIMIDVWWGLVERDQPGQYNFGGYNELLEMAKRHGLKVQAVMSFHQCGGNVGDSVTCVDFLSLLSSLFVHFYFLKPFYPITSKESSCSW